MAMPYPATPRDQQGEAKITEREELGKRIIATCQKVSSSLILQPKVVVTKNS
jgi:hypothetical protein